MKFLSLTPAVLTAGLALCWSQTAVAGEMPGTVPEAARQNAPVVGEPRSSALPMTASGLKVFYEKFGKYRVSADAAGSNDASHIATITKPSKDAVVDKAFVMAASYWNVAIPNGAVAIDGKPITWVEAVTNDIPSYADWFHSVRADVTSQVEAKINAAPVGSVSFTFTEGNLNSSIDGEIIVVVFKVPSATVAHTVSLLFGGQQLQGDRFELTLAKPFDKNKTGAVANMGLGISYSYQGTVQYSTVDVNGVRLSTAAGGQDDGGSYNGGLITVGGVGDSSANPADPNATPTNPRSDDEAYTLKNFIKTTDKVIRVDTANPSDDDNILFAWFDISTDAEVSAWKETDKHATTQRVII